MCVSPFSASRLRSLRRRPPANAGDRQPFGLQVKKAKAGSSTTRMQRLDDHDVVEQDEQHQGKVGKFRNFWEGRQRAAVAIALDSVPLEEESSADTGQTFYPSRRFAPPSGKEDLGGSFDHHRFEGVGATAPPRAPEAARPRHGGLAGGLGNGKGKSAICAAPMRTSPSGAHTGDAPFVGPHCRSVGGSGGTDLHSSKALGRQERCVGTYGGRGTGPLNDKASNTEVLRIIIIYRSR